MHRPIGPKSIVDVMRASLEGTDIFCQHREVQAEWLRLCVSATVVTSYNNRVYRIKQVHFDKDPSFVFEMWDKALGKNVPHSVAQYVETYYQRSVSCPYQPLLEAYPEHDTEQVFLLPEFCQPTGVTDEMRREKNPLSEVLKQIKVSAQERHNAVVNHAWEMRKNAEEALQAWGCDLKAKEPIVVEGRQLEPLQVAFTEKKVYAIDEGSFARSLRNGLQCAVTIDEWLLFYPQTDEPVLDIWLRSLRDVAKVAFGMQLSDPKKVCCTDQRNELQEKIAEHISASTQFMLLLIPNKDVRRVYQTFKESACCDFPCISQVVRSDTIRKRQSINSILHKVVQQVNAKFCGPLWHITAKDLEEEDFQHFRSKPFMIIGVDVYLTFEGSRWLGVSATLDKVYSQYYSMAAKLELGSGETWRTSLSSELQRLFRDALLSFAGCNDNILPETIVVYRTSVSEDEWPVVEATEVKAFNTVLERVKELRGTDAQGPSGQTYAPTLTFITIARKGHVRIFHPHPDMENIKNPEPGTVVDDPAICTGPVPNFYMVSQAIVKGSALPAHYSVLFNSAGLSLRLIQNLTNRLCLMYYNVPNAVRVPAPVLYATKVACFSGTVVKAAPHPRLERTLFFL